ncbi:MAG: SURF1 family protein [Oceanospirillales bacterium]|nr:SURF1 family protein [Oceanospirillales bacterium]
MGKRIGSRVWLYPLCLLLLALFCSLGFWQLDRAEQKRRWQAQQSEQRLIDPTPAELQAALSEKEWVAVSVDIDWLKQMPLYLDNRTHQGRAGYEVLLPARLGSGQLILTNIGWLQGPKLREQEPTVDSPMSGRFEGVVGMPVDTFRLNDSGSGADWRLERLMSGEAGERWGLDLPPWVLWLTEPVVEDVVARVPGAGTLPPERHLGYAVQWFALAFTLVSIVGVLEWKSRTRQRATN